MKVWISLLALVLGLSFVTPTMAAKGNKKGLRGQVNSFSGDATKGSLTVTTGGKKNPQDVTVATDDKTSVTLDGNPAKVTDLKAGLYVMVSPAEGTAATITASTSRPKKKSAESSEKTKKEDSSKSSDSSSSKTGDSK